MIQRDEQRCRSTESTDTNGALGEVGVRGNQDLELAEHADQLVRKVPVNNSGEVGPRTLREI